MTDVQDLPLDVSYTDEDIMELTARDRIAKGNYRVLVTDVARQVSEAGYLMLVPSVRILADPDDSSSVTGMAMRQFLCLPLKNPNWGDAIPDGYRKAQKMFLDRTAEFLRAVLGEDEIPPMPKWDKTNKCMMYRGEKIDNAEADTYKQEAAGEIMKKIKELWVGDPSVLLNGAPYCQLDYGKDDSEDFPRLHHFSAELPEGEQLGTGAREVAVRPAVAAKPAKGNGKPVGKPLAKPVAKKVGRR